jgi:hypothetical protein
MRFESICPACGRSFKNSHVEMLTFCSVGCQIDSEGCPHGIRKGFEKQCHECYPNTGHHPGCSVHDDGHCTCGYRAERETLERSPLAPGEGTWSVFAQKVVRERDDAREKIVSLEAELDEANAEIERLRWDNEMACENTPHSACECAGCALARDRARRGVAGPEDV